MSSIAAGTSAGSALVSTGDTTGILQLQVNGTTPAVTLNTSGAIGVGSSPDYGTSGYPLVSGGSAAVPVYSKLGVANINATGTLSSSTYLRGDGAWVTITIPPSTGSTLYLYSNFGGF